MATNLTNDPVPFTSRPAYDTNNWDEPLDAWITAVSADVTAVRNTADAAATAAANAATAAASAGTNASTLTSGTLPAARIADGSLALTKLAAGVATTADLTAVNTKADNAVTAANSAVTAATTPPTLPVKTIAGAYTFVLADTDSLLKSTSATAVTYTIPLNSTVAFAVGRSIRGYQGAAGAITFAGAVGVTVNALGGFKTTGGQFAQWEAFKVGTNEWLVAGEMA